MRRGGVLGRTTAAFVLAVVAVAAVIGAASTYFPGAVPPTATGPPASSTTTTVTGGSQPATTSTTERASQHGQAVPKEVLDDLAGVSSATLDQVGRGDAGLSTLTSVGPSPLLTSRGLPEVLYVGAEFCPYCAAERWAIVVALDRFGTFTGLEYMQSSSTDVYPDTPTFTFVNATYSSEYVAFVSVEESDRNFQPLQTPDQNESLLIDAYDRARSIPFVDFANRYALVGAQYLPSTLRAAGGGSMPFYPGVVIGGGGAPYDWTEIASQLNNPGSVFARSIDGGANQIISVICKIDGGQPSTVCSQSFAETLLYQATLGGKEFLALDRSDYIDST